jgi:hypothetical protein
MKKTNLFYFATGISVLSILTFSCVDHDLGSAVECSGTGVTFADVNSIIQSSCAANSGCHASGSNNGPGELLTYSQIYNARTSIRSSVTSGSMPRGGTLSSDEKNTIICWIENGAGNN